MAKKRNYKKEYKEYHGKAEQRKNRSARNIARAEVNKKRKASGKPKLTRMQEVDHKVPLSKGGSNKSSNLRVVSRKLNRSKGNKR